MFLLNCAKLKAIDRTARAHRAMKRRREGEDRDQGTSSQRHAPWLTVQTPPSESMSTARDGAKERRRTEPPLSSFLLFFFLVVGELEEERFPLFPFLRSLRSLPPRRRFDEELERRALSAVSLSTFFSHLPRWKTAASSPTWVTLRSLTYKAALGQRTSHLRHLDQTKNQRRCPSLEGTPFAKGMSEQCWQWIKRRY